MFGHSFLCMGLMSIMEIGRSVWWGTANVLTLALAQSDLAYIRPELIILKLA